MNVPTYYPLFENGQVLTSDQLNDIVDYLEPQDRIGRRLVGIGIVCGLEPDWHPVTRTLTLSAGMAVTSEGYMIAQDAVVFGSTRPYKVPTPAGDEASTEERERARYPFLFDGETQRDALELLPIDFERADGEPEASALTDAAVANKSVLLFLERNLEALKNCDINDCSDRGSEVSVTLRRLLVPKAVADQILSQEAGIAGRPVERAGHPRRQIERPSVNKLNLGSFGIDTLGKLHQRTLDTAINAFATVRRSIESAWNAYRPLLSDLYPSTAFPDGPVPAHFLLNAWAAYADAPMLVQYLHALARDLVLSHNEFLDCAATFEAECCPGVARFPMHVLAGDVIVRPRAFNGAPTTMAEYKQYQPAAAAQNNAGPEGPPAARRHHFIPSPAVAGASDRLAQLRALFARTILLAQSFATRDLPTDIRLTPSRGGAAPLGERAIPYYYAFNPDGDLMRNWSWRKARSETYASIYSYQFSQAPPDHPFLLSLESEDFIRIEGCVGRPLGSTIVNLARQRRELGLSFAIEPVWIAWDNDELGGASRDLARRATRSLLICRFNQIEIAFATMMDSLFEFAVWLVKVLGTVNAGKTVKPLPAPSATIPERTIPMVHATDFVRFDPAERLAVRSLSSALRGDFQAETVTANEVIARVVGPEATSVRSAAEPTVAEIYTQVSDERTGGELFDRLKDVIDRFDLGLDRETSIRVVYPSVALIARAQELMRATRAASFADFDEQGFGTVMRGFAAAYDAYAAVAETSPTATTPAIARANTSIIANHGFVAMMASQFASGSVTGRMDVQLDRIFNDMAMPRYAQLNPGLEHKGGVAHGGTYVLVYASRADLKRRMRGLNADLNKHLQTRAETIGISDLRIERQDPEAFARPTEGDDALEDFVVVADFCLPHLCCESGCADREVERRYNGNPVKLTEPVTPPPPVEPPPPPPEPAPPPPIPEPTPPPPTPVRGEGRLTISVQMARVRGGRETRGGTTAAGAAFARRGGEGSRAFEAFRERAERGEIGEFAEVSLPGSEVTIVNMEDGVSAVHRVIGSETTITLPAGQYAVSAERGGFSSKREKVELAANESKTVSLVIVMT